MDASMNKTVQQYGLSQYVNHGDPYNATTHNATHTFSLAFDPVMDKAISGISVVILFITMVSLGCTMELGKIKAHIMRPKGVAIALVAQFGIMPLSAFALAKILQMGPIEAVTVLICGCCPGGNLSNIFALALQGDMNLSIVMTTCSTVMALGMMPLLLYLYCQGFPNIENAVPYAGISIALVLTLVPCAIGIAINHWAPRYASIVTKVGLSLLLIASVAIGIMSGITVGGTVWVLLSPKMMVTASMMPLMGFLLGYFLSAVLRLNAKDWVSEHPALFHHPESSLSLEVIGPLFLFPLLYIMFQIIEALFLIILFRCYQRLKPASEGKTVYLAVDGVVEEVKVP